MTLDNLPPLDEADDLSAMPSKTFRVDFDRKRLTGVIDGLEAVKQSIALALRTEFDTYDIYSGGYGCELFKLIGMPPDYVDAEVPRIVGECLEKDDRVESWTEPERDADGVYTFTIVTQYGGAALTVPL